ncbi:phospholipase/carboxylesterase [Rhizobium sp. OAE497]
MPDLQGLHYIAMAGDLRLPPLLLMHGSSMDETELLPLAAEAAPDHPVISLRGGIAWEGGYAFFRRNSDRTLDNADLAVQTGRIHLFLATAIETQLISAPPILLGFSNGAIMAASLLMHDPACALGAVLIRPLSPAPDAALPPMAAKPILILGGEYDDRRQPEDAAKSAQQLQAAGAKVEFQISPTGHGLHENEPGIIKRWLETETFSLVAEDPHR